ncbi:hypothetical protein REPUB_Repub07fG0217200 [Reevesia pubescens]
MKEDDASGPPNKELYALLHLSPDASEEEIRKAYRQWAQVYHPDKYQASHMKEIATENFQRICEAYEILSDENKRQIYDIYGMEGLNSGLELGPKLNKVEEIKEQLEKLKRLKEQQKMSAHFLPSGSIVANLSLPQYLDGDGIMGGMAMASEVQSQLSKRNVLAIGGNLGVKENSGGGVASAVLRHQLSSDSSIELIGSVGLRSVIGVQTTRQLSIHSTATMGIAKSLHDGSINLSNSWTRQLSDTAGGNIELVLGPESSIGVGWQKKDQNMSAGGDVKFGTHSFGVSARYTHRFSSKSHGRIAGRIGSTALEVEVGGGRKVSDFSTVRMLYTIGIRGIFWRFELHRGGQKLIVPILLSRDVNPVFTTGAFVVPTSIYFILKKFVFKPYYLKREKQKTLENMERTASQVREAREKAAKAQQLLEIVANRKRNKQQETGGLVITKAIYGNRKALKKVDELRETNDELASQMLDVTLPLNFLINDSGQLKLHDGVKKSGIMGFCDPCPGESKQLHVEYTYHGDRYEVVVDDYGELLIPQALSEVQPLASNICRLNQLAYKTIEVLGCISYQGVCLFGFNKRIGIGSAFQAELQAIQLGLSLAWVRGYRSLIVESDCREAVLKLLHPVLDTDPHYHIILSCQSFLNKDWQCSINHCFREANTCADFLAKSASSGVCYQFSSPIGRLLELIRDDAFGVCRPRAFSLLM